MVLTYFVRSDEVHQAVDVGALAKLTHDVGERRGQFLLLVWPQILCIKKRLPSFYSQ